jgi:RNA polymerase sigma-70 factor (ECF subfamily)
LGISSGASGRGTDGHAREVEREDLARRAGEGDRVAMESLLRADYGRILSICRRLLRGEQDAEDAAQNALLSIATNITSFDRKSRYTTWSYRVALNAALDEWRRRQRRPLGLLSGNEPTGTVQPAADAEVADRAAIEWALSKLPVEQRNALLLRHYLDLGYAEIAAVERVPIGTVRSRIARGRLALADLLGTAGAAPSSNPTQMEGQA